MTDSTRGILRPDRLPRFDRVPPRRTDLAQWYWIPQWDLPPGVKSRQEVLSYPAANLVVEPDGVSLVGATTRATERVLTGAGWAVGALLLPAAYSRLTESPAALVDSSRGLDEPQLTADTAAALADGPAAAAAVLESWIASAVGEVTAEGRLANDMAQLLMTDSGILRVEDAAARLSVSVRTLQRLAHRTVGLAPAAMIRRRRLQEAAQCVRERPEVPLATIAAELGYSDQAHLANDFRTVLGFTPSDYRAASVR